ncbi:MAG: tetratricopeptide repeat protein [Muribaculaceae bacterium]|nr:tetratricopeptide repeat protein [Bacteroides sp.]MDE6681220.1 tetratricopeptide repeat protein [Muribaculaceae bacterium]
MNIITSLLTAFCACSMPETATTATPYMHYVDSADYYIAHSRWVDAERSLVAALRSEPANQGNMLLFSNLGTVRTQLGDYTGAIEAFDIGLSRAPRSTVLLVNRALAQIGLDNIDAALNDLSFALQCDPHLPRALETRGMLYLNRNELEAALADFTLLHELNAGNTIALAGMAQCQAAQGDYKDAISNLREIMKYESDEFYHFLLTLYLIENNQPFDAADAVRNALEQFPHSGRLYLLRAVLHKQHYQLSEAEAAIKLARKYGVSPELEQQLIPNHSNK